METKPSGTVICPECGILLASKNNLYNHKVTCHSVIAYHCACCGVLKSNRAKLFYHLQRSHQFEPRHYFRCSHCAKCFTSKQQLKVHFAHVHEALHRPFACEVCASRFLFRQDIENHQRTAHSTEKAYACSYCPARFKLKSLRSAHQIRVHGPRKKSFPCPFCSKAFLSNTDLRDHLLTHIDARLFRCKYCPASFKQRSGVNKHVKAKHQTNVERINCDKCSSSFITRDALTKHQKSHSKERPFGCAQCLCRFKSNPDLSRHVLRHSAVRPATYLCDECPASFISFTGFRNHKQRHANPAKSFKCASCKACFDSSGHLQRHQITHIDANAKQFICAVCSVGFKTLEYCAGHIRRVHHYTSTSFRCSLCPASFKLKSSLTYHELSHTGKRAYACQQCTLRFKTKIAVRQHQRTHSDIREKTHRCLYCPAAFDARHSLLRHIRAVHRSSFRCLGCDRNFLSADTLMRHKLKWHTARTRAFVCAICGAKHLSKYWLKKHIARRHAMSSTAARNSGVSTPGKLEEAEMIPAVVVRHPEQAGFSPTDGCARVKASSSPIPEIAASSATTSSKAKSETINAKAKPSSVASKSEFNVGDLVFAKMKGYPFWPGKIIDPNQYDDVKHKIPKAKPNLILFFGTHEVQFCAPKDIVLFDASTKAKFGNTKGKMARFAEAMWEVENCPDVGRWDPIGGPKA